MIKQLTHYISLLSVQNYMLLLYNLESSEYLIVGFCYWCFLPSPIRMALCTIITEFSGSLNHRMSWFALTTLIIFESDWLVYWNILRNRQKKAVTKKIVCCNMKIYRTFSVQFLRVRGVLENTKSWKGKLHIFNFIFFKYHYTYLKNRLSRFVLRKLCWLNFFMTCYILFWLLMW